MRLQQRTIPPIADGKNSWAKLQAYKDRQNRDMGAEDSAAPTPSSIPRWCRLVPLIAFIVVAYHIIVPSWSNFSGNFQQSASEQDATSLGTKSLIFSVDPDVATNPNAANANAVGTASVSEPDEDAPKARPGAKVLTTGKESTYNVINSLTPTFYIYSPDIIREAFWMVASEGCQRIAQYRGTLAVSTMDDYFINPLLKHPNRIMDVNVFDANHVDPDVLIIPILFDNLGYCNKPDYLVNYLDKFYDKFFDESENKHELDIYNYYRLQVKRPHLFMVHGAFLFTYLGWFTDIPKADRHVPPFLDRNNDSLHNFLDPRLSNKAIDFEFSYLMRFEILPENAYRPKVEVGRDLIVPYIANADLVKAVADMSDEAQKHFFSYEHWKQRPYSVFFRGSLGPKHRKEWRIPVIYLDEGVERSRIIVSDIERNMDILEGTDVKAESISSDKTYTEEIMNSQFCLFLKGDTYSSNRMYDMLMSNCIPIMVSSKWLETSAPYTWLVDYSKFVVFWIEQAQFNQKFKTIQLINDIVQVQAKNETKMTNILEYMNKVRQYLVWNINGEKMQQSNVVLIDTLMKMSPPFKQKVETTFTNLEM